MLTYHLLKLLIFQIKRTKEMNTLTENSSNEMYLVSMDPIGIGFTVFLLGCLVGTFTCCCKVPLNPRQTQMKSLSKVTKEALPVEYTLLCRYST